MLDASLMSTGGMEEKSIVFGAGKGSVGEPALPELIPVRMLNEFTYCPRLAYLEWVQGEWAENLETLEGTFGHRNVDVPGRQAVPAGNAPGDCASAESGSGEGAAIANGSTTCSTPVETCTEDRESNATQSMATAIAVGDGRSQPLENNDVPAEPGTTKGKRRRGAKVADSGEAPASIHARSLMLSSAEEGLVAKLDLLELDGLQVTPVDYKRGRVPDIPERAYEPERVQLCAQGLILRANGYDCHEGVLYFVESRQRVPILFDDALVARTRELVVHMRAAAAAGRLPPPLVDSPKCPRCSLVGICLPDETNFLLQLASEQPGLTLEAEPKETVAEAVAGSETLERVVNGNENENGNGAHPAKLRPAVRDGLRQLLTPRDAALPLYLQDQGLSLGKDGEQLVVRKKGELVKEVRLLDVSQVCLFGSVHVTEPALRELSVRGVPVCHFSYGGWFYAVTAGLVHKNVELRIRQYATAADPSLALPFARKFIAAKIRNCRTILRRHLDTPDKPRLMWQLNESIRSAERAESAESLLGVEGTAARLYFSGFGRLLRGGDEFDIEGRNRRPPRDPVNALLSFVYALLTKELTVTLQAVGFDPMLGLLHQPRYGRPSLALDLTEEFRPLIADSTVLTLINNGEVTPASFIRRAGAVALTDAGRRAVLAAFERRLNTEISHPLFGYVVSYRRLLQVQARLLARSILGELPEYPGFCTR